MQKFASNDAVITLLLKEYFLTPRYLLHAIVLSSYFIIFSFRIFAISALHFNLYLNKHVGSRLVNVTKLQLKYKLHLNES